MHIFLKLTNFLPLVKPHNPLGEWVFGYIQRPFNAKISLRIDNERKGRECPSRKKLKQAFKEVKKNKKEVQNVRTQYKQQFDAKWNKAIVYRSSQENSFG